MRRISSITCCRLCRTVLHVFVRALRSAYRRQARRQGLSGETGMVTSVQCFGGSVNVHLHLHTLVLGGVFVPEPDGTLRFHAASPLTDEDVRRVVARVRRRLERLGVTGLASADEEADLLADESAALASLSQAAILGRAALGPRAGRRPVRIGADPDAPWVERHVPLHAHEGGFDLRAAVHVAAGDRERLVRLVPRPRINLVLYHGVLAPNAPWRRAVVAGAEPEAGTVDPCPSPTPADDQREDATGRRARPKYCAWADLMRRAFEADVLACPKCGGRMTVLATIEDPAVIRRILTHVGLSMEGGEALPAARASP